MMMIFGYLKLIELMKAIPKPVEYSDQLSVISYQESKLQFSWSPNFSLAGLGVQTGRISIFLLTLPRRGKIASNAVTRGAR
jgi:hypothetical protein